MATSSKMAMDWRMEDDFLVGGTLRFRVEDDWNEEEVQLCFRWLLFWIEMSPSFLLFADVVLLLWPLSFRWGILVGGIDILSGACSASERRYLLPALDWSPKVSPDVSLAGVRVIITSSLIQREIEHVVWEKNESCCRRRQNLNFEFQFGGDAGGDDKTIGVPHPQIVRKIKDRESSFSQQQPLL